MGQARPLLFRVIILGRLASRALFCILNLTSVGSLVQTLGCGLLVALVQLATGDIELVTVPADALQLSLRVQPANDLADAVLLCVIHALVPLQLSLLLTLGCEC